jgi:alkanesulfonate monooxygenase SsuD/methylene tetrahydromethanopterin reductase-like flavin-dependent oxidoreductase (luciferase family)
MRATADASLSYIPQNQAIRPFRTVPGAPGWRRVGRIANMRLMRLGIALPTSESDGNPLRADSLAEAARRIEAAGFDSAWVFDSIGRGFLLPDPLTAIAVAATVTRRVELGTGVLQLPLRRPVELAHRILTTHLVSGGRLRLGVGAGSTTDDFAAVGVDFGTRFRQMDEALATMRQLWTGKRVGAAELGTWPAAAGGPPVLIGSWAGSRWIERAAREFDGWVGSGARSSWKLIGEGIRRFRGYGGTRAVLTNVHVRFEKDASPAGPDDPYNLVGPREIVADRLRHAIELGFDDLVLVARRHDAEHLAELRALVP